MWPNIKKLIVLALELGSLKNNAYVRHPRPDFSLT